MLSSPDVTVVIPTRDRWDLLSRAALPSALGQTGVELEVVVVDDGSVDDVRKRVEHAADSRLRVVRHDWPRGVAQARNTGIRAAAGRWIAFLDDDDLWAPDKLRGQVETAEAEDASFVYGGAAAIAEDRSWLYSLAPEPSADLARKLLSRNVLWGGSSNVVVRADLLRELGGFDERLFQLCDWDLWIRLAHAGTAAARDEVVVGCIVHARSMLLVSEDDVFEEFDYLVAKHRTLFEACGLHPDRRVFTRWVAHGHVRAGRRLEGARVLLRGAVENRDLASVPRALAALLGLSGELRRLVGARGAGRVRDPESEPAWLTTYREEGALRSDWAIRSASSPAES